MVYLFQQIFYRPVLNLIIFLYQNAALHDLGIAIIISTIVIRLILYPFFHSGAKQQMLMQRIQPHIKKIQEKHKDDRDAQGRALIELYKEHGVNPLSGILLLIIQLPILIAFNYAVRAAAGSAAITGLYSFISTPHSINTIFLGFINLAQPNWIVLIAAAVAQYAQARLAIYRRQTGDAPLTQAEKMARQMSVMGPVLTVAVFFSFPSALALYWLVGALFSSVQQYFINRHLQKQFGA